MREFLARFTSLASFRVFERRILLNLAGLRNGLVALGVLCFYEWQRPALGPGPAILLAPCNAVLVALASADFLERALRVLALGYPDNRRVSAGCELEGANTPTSARDVPEWEAHKYDVIPHSGDDPGPGHYPYPIPTFRGRVRAIWTGVDA